MGTVSTNGTGEPGHDRPQAAAVPASTRKAALKRNGWILLVLTFVVAYINGARLVTGVVVDVFQTGCLVAAIGSFVAAARAKAHTT